MTILAVRWSCFVLLVVDGLPVGIMFVAHPVNGPIGIFASK